MNLNDIINDFRAGMFKKFDFIDADVSRLANLRLSNVGSLSSSFTRRILDQLDTAPSTFLAAVSAATAIDTLLRTAPWAGAHYTYLLCRSAAVSSADCNRRSIYLREIAKSL
jgi:hypothetical protein